MATKRGRAQGVIVRTPLETFQGTKHEQLQELYDKWYGCQRCDLGKTRACGGNQDIVFGEGNSDAHVLIVGEAPGEEEEKVNVPFVGRSGHLLNQILAMVSDNPEVRAAFLDYSSISHSQYNSKKVKAFHEQIEAWRNREFFLTNAVSCRPPENAQPTDEHIKMCWERLWNIIYIIDPWLIVACGNSALSAVMKKKQVKISKMRGSVFDVQHEARICPISYTVIPVYHPSYLLRKADWKVRGGDFEKSVDDWKTAMRALDFLRARHLGTPIPFR